MKVNLNQLTATIEAVLFAAGAPVEIADIIEITGESDMQVYNALQMLSEKYQRESSGIILKKIESAYQLSTKQEYYEYLVKLVEPKRQTALSNAALETLSVIVYNQPVTRSSIEFIRGVNSDAALTRLIERGLVEECGRLDSPGKPLLYRTTYEFLKTFGLSSIEELPDIENVPLQLTFYDM